MKKIQLVSVMLALACLLCSCGKQPAAPREEMSSHELAEAVIQRFEKKQEKTTSGTGITTTVVDASHMEDPIPEKVYKYFIRVNLETNTVTVYAKDDGGAYTVPYLAMVCSTGDATPTSGVYYLPGNHWPWLSLQGDVYGQYVTQIIGNILFHSVPYETMYDKASLETAEFNKLGTPASMGCVRLQIVDAKWIYDNVDFIEKVEFYSDTDPGPLGKPEAEHLSLHDERSGWDPTDPDVNNPWLVNQE